MKRPIIVIKVGGKALYSANCIWQDIQYLVKKNGYSVLMVVGGSEGLKKAYAELGHEEKEVELLNGDRVRFCPPEEMPLIHQIYRDQILPYAAKKLAEFQLQIFSGCASDLQLIAGQKYPALKVKKEGRTFAERNSMVGKIVGVNGKTIQQLLEVYDVVMMSGPITNLDNQPLNCDADMLAAHVAVALQAQHVYFCTTTNGVLQNPHDKLSNIPDIYLPLSETKIRVEGRMKQKLRAAQHILENSAANIRIFSSETSLIAPENGSVTRVWRFGGFPYHSHILTRLVQIPSISRFEHEAVEFLRSEMEQKGFQTSVDSVGNVIGRVGSGTRHLLLLGHIDTVPGQVPLKLQENKLYGRGSVDAKGPLCCFIEATAFLSTIAQKNDVEICVVGAVEEEISTSRGAFHIRDTFDAEAVIIGEPSGWNAITLGYNGLFKAQVIIQQSTAHSASMNYRSCTDQIIAFLNDVRQYSLTLEKTIFSVRTVSTSFTENQEVTMGEFHIRIPYFIDITKTADAVQNFADKYGLTLKILRQTPGYLEAKNSSLTASFRAASHQFGHHLRLLTKTGTTDMNTLATKWRVPMVAYGPGDSSLDHTDHEHINMHEYEKAVEFLRCVLETWITTHREKNYEFRKISPSNSIEMR